MFIVGSFHLHKWVLPLTWRCFICIEGFLCAYWQLAICIDVL